MHTYVWKRFAYKHMPQAHRMKQIIKN